MSWSNLQPQGNSAIKNIVILGADIIGWCAAVGLARGLQGQQVNITVLDCLNERPLNQQSLTQSANEAVIHCTAHLFDFHRLLGIQDKQLLANGSAKLCAATQLTNFSAQHSDYFIGCENTQPNFCTVELHQVLQWLEIDDISPYSLSALAAQKSLLALPANSKDEIAAGFSPSLNLDAKAYLRFMQGAASQLGVKLIKATVSDICYHSENGFIKQFALDNGTTIDADLVLDNSGPTGVLNEINQQRPYVDCATLIPFDKKISTRLNITQQAKPYQQFIATAEGIVEISFMPQFHEISLYYASTSTSDEQAQHQLRKFAPQSEPLELKQVQYAYTEQAMFKNCFALGTTAGYLGSSPFSNLILCQRSISKLLDLFPGKACLATNSAELNRRIATDYQQALDYSLLMLLYAEGQPSFSWQLSQQQLPAILQQKITLFSSSGRVASELNPLVSRIRWLTLLKHKVLDRHGYEPVLDALDKSNARQFLLQLSLKIQQCLSHYRPYN